MDGQRLYVNIADELSHRIVSGTYVGGQRLPGEIALGNSFGVSRTTIRAAIDILVDKGLVIRRNGSGVFVSGQISTQNILEMTKVIKPETWEQSSANVREAYLRKAGNYYSRVLDISPNELVYRIVYTQVVKGKTLQESLILPLSFFPNFDLSQIQILSVLELMNTGKKGGKSLRQELELIVPSKQMAKTLKLSSDSPVFKFTNYLLDEQDHPIAVEYRFEDAMHTKYLVDYS